MEVRGREVGVRGKWVMGEKCEVKEVKGAGVLLQPTPTPPLLPTLAGGTREGWGGGVRMDVRGERRGGGVG